MRLCLLELKGIGTGRSLPSLRQRFLPALIVPTKALGSSIGQNRPHIDPDREQGDKKFKSSLFDMPTLGDSSAIENTQQEGDLIAVDLRGRIAPYP